MTIDARRDLSNEQLRSLIGGRLSNRALNVLRTLGVFDRPALLILAPEQIAAAKNCGRKTLREISEAVLDSLPDSGPNPMDQAELKAIRSALFGYPHKEKSKVWSHAIRLLAEVDRLHAAEAK